MFSLYYIVKNEKACSEENTESMAEQQFDKEILSVTHGLNQSSQQKPGIEEFYQQKHCQFELQTKQDAIKEGSWTLGFYRLDH